MRYMKLNETGGMTSLEFVELVIRDEFEEEILADEISAATYLNHDNYDRERGGERA